MTTVDTWVDRRQLERRSAPPELLPARISAAIQSRATTPLEKARSSNQVEIQQHR